MIYFSPINKSSNGNFYPSFKAKNLEINISKTLEKDLFEKNINNLKRKLLEIRNSYIENNKEAFLTLDHIKSNFDNHYVLKSVQGQTRDLQAVSTEDFCDLSEIMKNIRLPQKITVYRAMEAADFNIERIVPEKFFEEYFSEGKKVVVPIYMSTSLNKNIAFGFAEKNPYRFIIKLNLPKDHPAVYMENLTPNDANHYGNEEEINVIKNSEVVIKNLKKITNPLNNKEIYEIEGDIVGFIDVKPKPKEEFKFNDDMLELLKVIMNSK